MSRFAKVILSLFSIAVIVTVGIIGFHIHSGSSSNNSTPSTAQAITCNDWNRITSPSPGSAENALSAIAAVSARDVWAAGMTKNSNGQQALFEHWNGSTWQVVPAPATGSASDEVHGIAVLSANDVWAVGSSYNFSANSYGALIEHWNGTKWNLVTSAAAPMRDNNLETIAAVSSHDIWAVGLSFSGVQNQPRQTLIEHWNGKSWSVVNGTTLQGASSGSLNAVSAVSRNDVWAVGQVYTPDAGDRALAKHWNGKTWSSVPISNPESKADWLNNLSIISANDIWAVGEYEDYNTRLLRTFALHWDGKQWGLSQWPWKYGQANGSDSFSVKAVVAIDKQHIWSVGSVASITQNPPIDNPPINGATQTFTLFRC